MKLAEFMKFLDAQEAPGCRVQFQLADGDWTCIPSVEEMPLTEQAARDLAARMFKILPKTYFNIKVYDQLSFKVIGDILNPNKGLQQTAVNLDFSQVVQAILHSKSIKEEDLN